MAFQLAFYHIASLITYALGASISFYTLKLLVWGFKPLLSKPKFPGVPGPQPQSWITGNLGQLFTSKGLPFHQHIPDCYGGVARVYGFFGDEQLYISDPRALHSILVREQDAFEETAVFIEFNKVIFGPGLVATVGEQHKRQRKIVKPAFSITQLKNLTPTLYALAEKLSNIISNEARKRVDDGKVASLDMSEWMSRIALESVGQTVLGYSFDPLDSRQSNKYTSAVKELIPTLFSLSLIRQFAPFLVQLGSPSFRRWAVERVPHEAVRRVKDMSDVMYETARGILEGKRKRLDRESDGKRRDIVSELLRTNNDLPDDSKMSDEELIGQMTVLIFGAQDTTSSALSRALYLLATHQDIQERLRSEIHAALRDNDCERLPYDAMIALPLLDAVLRETLRLFPPVPFVRRTTLKTRSIPYTNSKGEPDSVVIPQGTTLFVGIAAANRLQSIWGDDSREWKPERWLRPEAGNNEHKLPGIYAGTLSFLGGGRSCVGYKLADIEMKIIISTLVSRFRFSLTKDTIVWNLSQIISPSVASKDSGGNVLETKGMPLVVEEVSSL
ncbi:hypothetical protein ONZ45_g13796 [Pleurotus djamor]|nr:hypothetical protein ONZ45_g13796 [Pleurotus djamor]